MTMEAIQQVAAVEEKGRTDKAEAEARVKQALSDAEREGAAQLQKARHEAADNGKELLKAAEARAAEAAAEIAKRAEGESDALRRAAKGRLDKAAELIVGRVVKS